MSLDIRSVEEEAEEIAATEAYATNPAAVVQSFATRAAQAEARAIARRSQSGEARRLAAVGLLLAQRAGIDAGRSLGELRTRYLMRVTGQTVTPFPAGTEAESS